MFCSFSKEATATSSGNILDCGALSLRSPWNRSVILKYTVGPTFQSWTVRQVVANTDLLKKIQI